jgi:hypothetical protein
MGTEGWQPTAPEAPAPLPVAGANSVLFYCQFTADPAVATTFGFDRFYVSKVPAQY